MELPYNLVRILEEAVLNPDIGSAISVLFFSFVSEIIAVFPSALVLSSPLLFLEEPWSMGLAAKLFFFIAVPFGIGNTIGSLPVYALSYFGGKPAIEKFHKYLKFSWKDVERIENKFKGLWYDEIIFLVMRILPFIPTLPVNVAAGVLRMRLMPYLVLMFIGMTLRMMAMFIAVSLGGDSLD